MKQWETSELYREVKSRPSEDGSLPFQKDSEGINTEARRRCLHLLEYSPRTIYQLKKRLMDDGFSAEQADDAIRYAESFGYVDDGNYAMEYVRTGCQKKSRRQLYMQLSSRGVDKESIEDALEAYGSALEMALAAGKEREIVDYTAAVAGIGNSMGEPSDLILAQLADIYAKYNNR